MTKKETIGTNKVNNEVAGTAAAGEGKETFEEETAGGAAAEEGGNAKSKDEAETTAEEKEEKSDGGESKRRKHSKEKELESKLHEQHDKYLRLSAEFDNYRKRAMKERIELTQYISAEIYVKMLPVIDDFERAYTSIKDTDAMDAIRQGIELIYNKFKEHLNQQGVKEIDAFHKEFNTDYHDAVSRFPVQDEELKGKVIDVIEKGYMLNDKVIRYCKVIVGE
jgi:molecular chaperone GrpE